MAHRIEVTSVVPDTRAEVRKRKLADLGFPSVQDVELIDVYTVDEDLDISDLERIAGMLVNTVVERARFNGFNYHSDWAVEIGFLPGVTDNVGNTVRQEVEDLLGRKSNVYTSQLMLLRGQLSGEDVVRIANSFSNPLINRVHIKSLEELRKDGMGIIIPRVRLDAKPRADLVAILNASDEELQRIGKLGIFDHNREVSIEVFEGYRRTNANDLLKLRDAFESDGKFFVKVRRGPLALDLTYMRTIQDYFRRKGRNPTDVELESLAQTWSEHCKHTIFADPIDDIQEGLFRIFIKGATERIRREKIERGERDFCVSVFTDNSGAIEFDDLFLVSDKVETHNTPSALDPFGGSITGIVGVDRDSIGFGLGAKPFAHRYGFCFGDPDDERILYRGKDFTDPMLPPRRTLDGVINGVNVGGNCSGITTSQGFIFFDERYRGKPLVFVGTLGIIPRESAGRQSYEKKANPGDWIVMIGGSVGKDGIHGATFSSEALDSGSPATAVQIGDPITQKKLSDAVIKEARDLGLFTSITDNGAGGLSCSVAEMARESGGCFVNLDTVPLKYQGLKPWEIWVSESQERMTLAVPKNKWSEFSELMRRRDVAAIVIGEFNDSGKCAVEYEGETVMDIDMKFLHDGLPQRPMMTEYVRKTHEEPDFLALEDLTESLHFMLARKNIASFEFISMQYDHEVQGGSILKPLQGRGRINGDATVIRPVLNSRRAVVLSQGINPSYGDIDTYHMAACSIDTAIRNAVCAGASLKHLALLDNFCWCSSNEAERLGQLKEAARACYDYAVAFGTPFISGKDSMFNDFKGYDEKGNPIKISVPPTLLVSSLGVIEDSTKVVSLDAKVEGDVVYVLGETSDHLGGSEYFAVVGKNLRRKEYIGNNVPKVDAEKNKRLYFALSQCIEEGLVASAQSVHRGGLAVALTKTAMGGLLGMNISLRSLPGDFTRDDFALYSESQGRIVVTVDPRYAERFERIMEGNVSARIGTVRGDNLFVVEGKNGREIIRTDLDKMLESYKGTFRGY